MIRTMGDHPYLVADLPRFNIGNDNLPPISQRKLDPVVAGAKTKIFARSSGQLDDLGMLERVGQAR